MAERESSLAVLVDYENMARPGAKGRGDFDIHLVLDRLADKGRVLVKRAYADWNRYRDARHELQNAGLGLIEMPSAREGAKNRADIQMAVDAMEIAYSREHVDTFVIVSGDSDFTPLVGKLRELNKRVIGVGNRESASELLVANCDEFIYYDNLVASANRSRARGGPKDPVEILRATLEALQREGTEWPLASHVKDTMRRKYPAFGESDLGFSTFSKFLEDLARKGIVRLENDPRSGTYRVELADGEAASTPPVPVSEDAGDGRRRRRRRRGGAARETGPEGTEGTETTEALEPELDTEGYEVFTVEITPQAPEPPALPPLDQPISYEDMIALAPDPGDEPVLLEASDQATPPSRSSRRRRRRGATGDPEPTGADLEALAGEEADEILAEAEAETIVEVLADVVAEEVEAIVEAAEEAEAEAEVVQEAEEIDAAAARRRVRRRSAPPPEDEVPAPVAEAPAPVAEAPPALESVDAAAVAAATAERRRVRRRSAGAEAEAAEAPAAEAAEAPADEAPKPARRRRTTKAAAAEAEAAEAPADAAAEEAPKPARRRRTTKAAAEAEAPADAAAEEAPKPARRRRTTKAAAEAEPSE